MFDICLLLIFLDQKFKITTIIIKNIIKD